MRWWWPTWNTGARIVKRTLPDGRVTFVIQQRNWLFRWHWEDAWLNSASGAACQDSFPTLADARANLCYFDGTGVQEEVVE